MRASTRVSLSLSLSLSLSGATATPDYRQAASDRWPKRTAESQLYYVGGRGLARPPLSGAEGGQRLPPLVRSIRFHNSLSLSLSLWNESGGRESQEGVPYFRACPLARGAPPPLPCVPARTLRPLGRPEGVPVRARSHAARTPGVPRGCPSACPLVRGAHGRSPRVLPCVPARTRGTLACHTLRTLGRPAGVLVRARSLAARDGVPRKRLCACPLARGAHGCGPRALPCVPACTRRTPACPEGVPVRARSHAARPWAPRGLPRACPLARCTLRRVARGAPLGAPRAPPCVPARTRRTLACRTLRILGRPENVPVRARSHAAHSGVTRMRFGACPLARGAYGRGPMPQCVPARRRRILAPPKAAHPWRAPRVLPCVPARTWRSWAQPKGAPVRARSRAARSGVSRGASPCVPAPTRHTLACPEGDSVRARSHAALMGAARGCSRACPLVRGAPRRLTCGNVSSGGALGARKSRASAPSGA